jgi:hypothetical protein
MKGRRNQVVGIVYHADLNEAQGAALAAMPPARGPFDRPEWAALLASECLADHAPLLAMAQDGEAILAMFLMSDGPRRLASLTNWYSFWWRPLGEMGLLTSLAGDIAGKADVIRLSHMPEREAGMLARAFRKAGWAAFVRPCDVNHYLPVGGRSFAEYWAARPGQLRETVRRKGRKGVVDLHIATEFSGTDWAAYESVYRLSWKPGEGSPEFLRQFAMAEGAAGRLRLGVARIAGKPVAAQFWTVEAGTAFIHKLAHDELAKKHSPGTLLSAALFEHVIDRDKVSEIDFGTGDDPYKRDWMEAVRTRHAVILYRLAAPRIWPELVRSAAKHWLGR